MGSVICGIANVMQEKSTAEAKREEEAKCRDEARRREEEDELIKLLPRPVNSSESSEERSVE